MTEIRIDELARRAGLTVDTIRFYQREGLLPPAQRAGRAKVYGQDHLARLAQIRDLQTRRFSLAAIKALLESERPGARRRHLRRRGHRSPTPWTTWSSAAAAPPSSRPGSAIAGLLRDPAEFGRDTYDATDLDVLRAVVELERLGLPDDVLVELASIYVQGVEGMQREVLELFSGHAGPGGTPRSSARSRTHAAAAAGQLLPLVTRIVEYVHQRTLAAPHPRRDRARK